ncbi:MAG: TerC/Alx family metal homeostasis membrane protein [Bacteroidetes bacterium]|nr:MAG: TerC/Alx family metal homeostasis membrane protein [Bacteroidota bacterium]
MPLRKAVYWSIFWVALSLLFNLGVYYVEGPQKALEFFTGYIIEKSLSVDNLFVFLILFGIFGVELKDQRRVLNYGIVGVIILRGILILLGTALVKEFHWVLYLFGVMLIYAGYRVVYGDDSKIEPEKNLAVRLFRKIMPVDNEYHGHRFFIRREHRLIATPLFVCLLVVETTDVVFAIDSIPAIFAITTDPFIVLSSNLMAVLGLRSLYFVLAEIHASFTYVKYGVGVVLAYVGLKMLMMDLYKIDTIVSLGIILSILTVSVILSVIHNKRHPSS